MQYQITCIPTLKHAEEDEENPDMELEQKMALEQFEEFYG